MVDMAKLNLYLPSKPYKEEYLNVSDLHSLYIAEYGKPDGKPVVVIHGGPGGQTFPDDARFFNPEVYRVILFDQRGSGKSKPAAELEDNTTWALVEDLEKIRKHLQIEKWHLHGGSWGSTLQLAYAQTHPEPVLSMTMRGVFTLRRSELEFFYQGPGTGFLFPDYWEQYEAVIPEEERGDMIEAYYKRLTGPEPERQEAAKAWATYELATCYLKVDPDWIKKILKDGFADRMARIEAHYFVNGGFIREGQLLEKEQIDKIRHIPATIVQGRYDVVCPAKTAWDLHKAWPEAKFILTPKSGHNADEPQNQQALLAAADEYGRL
ncbi:proline iminopeptidase [Cystobasidium minutum MCA 4210]|uniref:proline iminopeptidase n=1 Tax=Cystobasidium minutum MCA 4210 TaxID=1397322 RepID=UPI0034CEBA42|eukprot:jgi/Rhomi1/105414/CE105413_125